MPISPDSGGYGLVEYLRNHVSDRRRPPAKPDESFSFEETIVVVPDQSVSALASIGWVERGAKLCFRNSLPCARTPCYCRELTSD